MARFALRIEYDGAPFHGWQRQAGGIPTVQEAIEGALDRIEPGPHRIAAAGRTDTGVHALGQVAHCDLARAWDPARLVPALNWHLRPLPVAITAAAAVPGDFHARFSAIGRRYLFRLVVRRPPVVHERGRVWQRWGPLDVDAMRRGAAHLVGQHDFTTFRSSICQAKSPVKTLDAIIIEECARDVGCELRFHLRARSFLHHQVRSIIGTLERVGRGAWRPDDVRTALERRDRAACGPVAPPDGLYLAGVSYPAPPFADTASAAPPAG